MKRLLCILSVVAMAFSQDSTSFKTGYYLTIQDFIKNTPTAPTKPTRVEEGRGEFMAEASAYYVMEEDSGTFEKVRGESFKGYCDSGKVYLVDNANLFKGRIMRSVKIGKKYSYYHGVDFQTTTTGFGAGGMNVGSGMKVGGAGGSTTTPVPVLVVINMKTGESTTLQQGMFMKANMNSLLAEYPDLLKEYKAAKIRTLTYAASCIDKINAR